VQPGRTGAPIIKTVHRQGYRVVATVTTAEATAPPKRWPNSALRSGGDILTTSSRLSRLWTRPRYSTSWGAWWRRSCSTSEAYHPRPRTNSNMR
jgi:hypothetical protein